MISMGWWRPPASCPWRGAAVIAEGWKCAGLAAYQHGNSFVSLCSPVSVAQRTALVSNVCFQISFPRPVLQRRSWKSVLTENRARVFHLHCRWQQAGGQTATSLVPGSTKASSLPCPTWAIGHSPLHPFPLLPAQQARDWPWDFTIPQPWASSSTSLCQWPCCPKWKWCESHSNQVNNSQQEQGSG